MSPSSIPLDCALSNGEVGCLVDIELIEARHPDGLSLSADQWASLHGQRRDVGRALRWWEVDFHG